MKDLKYIKFKNVVSNTRGCSLKSTTNYMLYFYPTTKNSVRLFVLNKDRVLDKIGTIKRSFKNNEVHVTLNFTRLRFWVRAGVRVSFDNYLSSLVSLGLKIKYRFR